MSDLWNFKEVIFQYKEKLQEKKLFINEENVFFFFLFFTANFANE